MSLEKKGSFNSSVRQEQSFNLFENGDNAKTIKLSAKEFEAIIRCRICLNTIKDANLNQCCMSRFCGICLSKSLKFGHNRCPSCKKCLIKRGPVEDKEFQKIVDLFVCREDDELPEEVLILAFKVLKGFKDKY